VVYLRPAAMVKSAAQPPLADRLALQSASNEAGRLLFALASAAAGYQVDQLVQVSAAGADYAHLRFMFRIHTS